jgi:predicted amidohydrolase YtcJ
VKDSVVRVFAGCRIYTLNPKCAIAEAIAVHNGKVLAVGSADEVRYAVGHDAEWTDMEGLTIVPGLIDSHNHLVHYGISATHYADLSGCRSVGELLKRLQHFREANPTSAWIIGERFDHELLAEGRWPTRRDLDRVSPEVPIVIVRLCLHALVANSAALEPVKGQLSHEQLETGLLTEDAMELIWSQIPEPSRRELESAALWAAREARRVGLTGVHVMLNDREEFDAFCSLRDRDRLPVRIYAVCPADMLDYLRKRGLRTGSGDEWLRIGGLKLFADGAMGARTAAMRQPFADCPDEKGVLFRNERDIAIALEEMQTYGFQACIHAIGDLAIECALEGIRQAQDTGNRGNILRHRIEHASQMADDLIEKMRRLNVIASVQPQFVVTDFWTYDRVGPERYRWSYPFKTMLDAGIMLAMGSDCPVERLSPIELVDRAVNREPRSLQERLTVEETLRAYTWGSAFAGFSDNQVGSIEPGKWADFTVLSDDVFALPSSQLASVRVEGTIVGGFLELDCC